MNKRKWKVYTTDELRDRFTAKPGQGVPPGEDPSQKVVVPNLKRRNSAPPGMIHFPPGTFSANSPHNAAHPPSHNRTHSPQPPTVQQSPPISTRQQQHELVTHARSSPTLKPTTSPYPSRLEKRRASLPYIPPDSSSYGHSHPSMPSSAPAIEAYFKHLQNIPLPYQPEVEMDDEDAHHHSPPAPAKPPHSPSQPLPSFQSFLKTIQEDADEEDKEIREIEERATMQGSKSLPMLKEVVPKQQYNSYNNQQQYNNNSQNQEQPRNTSPSSKFYKNNVSKSNDNLPSLSRMSISDIIG